MSVEKKYLPLIPMGIGSEDARNSFAPLRLRGLNTI